MFKVFIFKESERKTSVGPLQARRFQGHRKLVKPKGWRRGKPESNPKPSFSYCLEYIIFNSSEN
jgi:hypothetical protein